MIAHAYSGSVIPRTCGDRFHPLLPVYRYAGRYSLLPSNLRFSRCLSCYGSQSMRPFELIHQYHFAIDLKRFAAFAAGFQVESLFHHVGVVERLGFKGILFARRHGLPERHKCPLSGILFSECQTFSFGANVALGLFLDFFGLLALLSLVGTFEAGW